MTTTRLKIEEDPNSCMPRVDVPMVSARLKNMRAQIPAPINSIYGISEVVCRALGVELSDIKVKSRVRDLSIARQACMAILRAVSVIKNGYVPKYSFKEIADSFNKDHATVIYSCNKFYRDYKHDIVIRKSLEAIIENCDNVYIAEIASKIKDGYYENAITKRKKTDKTLA